MGVEDKNEMVAQLAAEQGPRLRQFLRRRVRNAADIPDLVQEVFLRLLRVPHHESIRNPEAYLMTIASHVAQQHGLQAAPQSSVDLEAVLADPRSCSAADPALEVTAEECCEAMEATLRGMAPKMQATFLLHRRDGLTMERVSERLGISRPMAKKYLVKERFIHSQRPIRVWYNTVLSCGSGAPPGPELSAVLSVDLPDLAPPACTLANSRLVRSSTGTSIGSAIVIVDQRRMKNVTLAHLADYIALAGLTDVRLDADTAPEPSILQLFGKARARRRDSVRGIAPCFIRCITRISGTRCSWPKCARPWHGA